MPRISAPCTAQRDKKVMRLRYRSGPMIGEGSFGRVYMAVITNEHTLRPVALKKVHVTDRVTHPPLLHEAATLLRLRGHCSIPEVYGWGSSQHFEYLSLQLLGPDLYTWFVRVGKPLTTRNLAAIVWQMLDVLEYVHSKGVIHCDIKPSNILLGRGNNKSQLFLGDFGISLPFDPNAPPSERTTFPRGSAYYMSLNNHLRRALSPHDDMESLAYTIIELHMGHLPWEGCGSHADVFVAKQMWTGEHWTATTDCPKAFGDFLDAVRDRAQALDYVRWKENLCGDSTPTSAGAEGPDNFRYDPLDDSAPIRRSVYDSQPHQPLTASGRELARVPQSPEPWPTLSGSSNGFYPRSTWSEAFTLEEAASFRGERELVLRELAFIDRLPVCGSRRGSEMVEVMRRFDDLSDESVNSAEGGYLGIDDEDRNSGRKQVDSGYSGSEDSDKDRVQVPEVPDEGDVMSVFDNDLDFRQFYDPEYDNCWVKG